jgi:hypothetical protein
MPNGPDPCESNRAELIRLLEGDEDEEWRIAGSALNDGRRILPDYRGHFGAYAINLFILDLLRANFPMHQVILGSGKPAWVMNTHLTDGRPLYIKLTVEDEIAVILSFHVSVH